MFVLCAFFLQAIVILLQHSDQLLIVVDLLSVKELNLLCVDTVVLGNVGHLTEGTILCEGTFELIGLLVDFLKELYRFLVFCSLFCS